MIHTEAATLDEVIDQALNKAVQTNQKQLVSIVEHIKPIDPFVFHAGAAVMNEPRLFWKSADEDVVMAGVGAAIRLSSAKDDRFQNIQDQWKQLMEHAYRFDRHEQKGTGPVAMGGFSFDPRKENTELWSSFGNNQLEIPSYLLTIVENEHYFTINAVIYPDDHKEQLKFQWEEAKSALLQKRNHTFIAPEILERKEIEPDEWKRLVKKATEDIEAGVLDKVVLAREIRLKFDENVDISQVLQHLDDTQTNSYIFAFESEGAQFVGATPERLVKVENQQLLSTCLAGTIPRGGTADEDVKLGQELLEDGKNLEEHQFVVRMIRDAIVACSEEVDIPDRPVLYPLKNLQHLYTPVRAQLKQEHTLLDVVARLHPTPALGGLPQEEALAYIREFEPLDRGWYAGPVGWFDSKQNGEFAVAIRSALVNKNKASLFSGCGIVKDSDPEMEYEETAIKFTPMLAVLGGA
ncbi:menaquinone-specific isochorismate synthase [Thalassobacillus cyri]|uniref:Isochorismate synthase MenF n=1 Tax=Thalassobacillus cyri TaxID=571932 RepID=A0A1H4G5Z4_9BACI|nr:isochorismate synthase [Thalassobacillus cyri]SEB05025.1 menaquinone-specific isochorismate synthase [Thalassobacillus cyri]